MKQVEIFDPAMCCSTGVCGPSIDPELLRVATVLDLLKEKGSIIKRHGLAINPQDYLTNKVINDILDKEGADVLPVTLVDGKVAKTKKYPTNEELSEWLGIPVVTKSSPETGGSGNKTRGCC